MTMEACISSQARFLVRLQRLGHPGRSQWPQVAFSPVRFTTACHKIFSSAAISAFFGTSWNLTAWLADAVILAFRRASADQAYESGVGIASLLTHPWWTAAPNRSSQSLPMTSTTEPSSRRTRLSKRLRDSKLEAVQAAPC